MLPFPHNVESGGKFLRCKKICWSVNVKPFRNGFNGVSVIWFRVLKLSVFSFASSSAERCQHFTSLLLLADDVKFCHIGWKMAWYLDNLGSGGKFLRYKNICWSVYVKPFRNGSKIVHLNSAIFIRFLLSLVASDLARLAVFINLSYMCVSDYFW